MMLSLRRGLHWRVRYHTSSDQIHGPDICHTNADLWSGNAHITGKKIKTLDQAHLKMIKDLMSLRNRTTSSPVYLLMGVLSVRAEIHIQMLKMYGAITQMPNGRSLKLVSFRQLSVRAESAKSCIAHVLPCTG